jgi:hypothetical protein
MLGKRLMYKNLNLSLLLAASMCVCAAIAHFACIPIGAPAYRFLGAGEVMANMAEHGHIYPDVISSIIGTLLLLWSAYAFAAAGLFAPLPFSKWMLLLIAFVLLARAVFGYPLLKNSFPDNSLMFWWVSSSICFVMGIAFALGLKQIWKTV